MKKFSSFDFGIRIGLCANKTPHTHEHKHDGTKDHGPLIVRKLNSFSSHLKINFRTDSLVYFLRPYPFLSTEINLKCQGIELVTQNSFCFIYFELPSIQL